MSRTPKKRRRKTSSGRIGLRSAPSLPVPGTRLFVQLARRLGRTLIGVLPCSRRIRAANDPQA